MSNSKYVTKDQIIRAIKSKHREVSPSFPILAFNNEEQEISCDNCGSTDAFAFRYNAAKAARTDSVLFKWAPRLYRIIARGFVCYNCDWHRIWFEYPKIEGSHKENNPDRVENVEIGGKELVSEYQGDNIEDLK
jgi:hypothetical protein